MAINLHRGHADWKSPIAAGFTAGRLVISPMTPQDRDTVLGLLDLPDMLTHLPALLDRRDAASWLDFVFGKRNYLFFTAVHRETRHTVGFIVIDRTPDNRLYLGGAVARTFWGKGYATEILYGLRRHLERVFYSNPLYADVLTSNTAVLKILEKTGFEVIQTANNHVLLKLTAHGRS